MIRFLRNYSRSIVKEVNYILYITLLNYFIYFPINFSHLWASVQHEKSVSSTIASVQHKKPSVQHKKKTVTSTYPSVQQKELSVQHTRQLNTKNRQFNIPVSSTQKTVTSTYSSWRPSVQHKKRQFNTPVSSTRKKSYFCWTEVFVLNWCVEITGVLNWGGLIKSLWF